MNKKSAGFIFTLLSLILAMASVAAYLINCRTEYFSKFGIDKMLILVIAAGILLQVVYLITGGKMRKIWLDILPIASCAFMMAGAVQFLGARINEIAFIMTFQKNSNTLADMKSAVAGILLIFAAVFVGWISSFFDMNKTEMKTQ